MSDKVYKKTKCILSSNMCIDLEDSLIREALKVIRITYNISSNRIEDILKYFNISETYDLWKLPQIKETVGYHNVLRILHKYYKAEGPWNDTELLSNIVIDDVLSKWQLNCIKLFNKKFCTVKCVCIDFDSYDNELRDLNLTELKNCDVFAAVINTDVNTGPGKHWVCVVISSNEILYFNSSSNPPPARLEEWFAKLIIEMQKVYGKNYRKRNIVNRPVQSSNTECGMWCLVFIRSILLGYKPEWIITANDKEMMEFRRDVFLNE